jgi:hypothetical protein
MVNRTADIGPLAAIAAASPALPDGMATSAWAARI